MMVLAFCVYISPLRGLAIMCLIILPSPPEVRAGLRDCKSVKLIRMAVLPRKGRKLSLNCMLNQENKNATSIQSCAKISKSGHYV